MENITTLGISLDNEPKTVSEKETVHEESS
jgi:hypothetical protein